MGKYDVEAEEDAIRNVLAGKTRMDDVVKDAQAVQTENSIAGLLARISVIGSAASSPSVTAPSAAATSLYPSLARFLDEALEEAYKTPQASLAAGGVGWRDYGAQQIVELVPPADLRQRLEVLPQAYLAERKVTRGFKLVTSRERGRVLLADALTDETDSSWPEAHYLGPLHPVIDWAADRAMASLGRNQVFAVRGRVDHPTVLLLGTLTNRRGQVVASSYLTAEFPKPANPGICFVTPYESAAAMVAEVGYAEPSSNPGPVVGLDVLQPLIAHAVRAARTDMNAVFGATQKSITGRVQEWSRRAVHWEEDADALIQRQDLVKRRVSVQKEKEIADRMVPERQLVRPLLIVVPADTPASPLSAGTGED